jgi:hypothetical protein
MALLSANLSGLLWEGVQDGPSQEDGEEFPADLGRVQEYLHHKVQKSLTMHCFGLVLLEHILHIK